MEWQTAGWQTAILWVHILEKTPGKIWPAGMVRARISHWSWGPREVVILHSSQWSPLRGITGTGCHLCDQRAVVGVWTLVKVGVFESSGAPG